MNQTESLHLRLPADIVQAVDVIAGAWGVSRNEASARLLKQSISTEIAPAVATLTRLAQEFAAAGRAEGA